MTTLGAIFHPHQPPEQLRAVVRAAEDAGLDELWLWEDCFFESGIAAAAAALGWTERLRVGVGLLPVPLRNVALTAMEVATLERMFPGRPIIGVGHGVQEWMRQVGAKADSPLTLLREYLIALRSLLAGDEVSTSGRYVNLEKVALDWPPDPAPTVLAGATGQRSLRLCGEFAGGIILTSTTSLEGVREARRIVDEARPGQRLPITTYLLTGTGAGAAERVSAEARRTGAGDASTGVAGDAAAVADAVAALVDAGTDNVVLEPAPDEPDSVEFVRFAAQQVRPLLG